MTLATLARDARLLALAALTLIAVVAAAILPAMPQPLSYHAFADCRGLLGIANFSNVATNLPFLFAGAWGLAVTLRSATRFHAPLERLPYLIFFLGAALTFFGSAYYHLAPDNTRLVWDRLPMTLAFAGLAAAVFTERISPAMGQRALWPLVIIGAATVMFWHATERAGVGNVIPYGVYQGWTIIVLVLVVVMYPAQRYSHGRELIWPIALYGAAKIAETFDLEIYRALGQAMSGHSIKHLLAGAAVFAIGKTLSRREPRGEALDLARRIRA